jgi:hypothetical protein
MKKTIYTCCLLAFASILLSGCVHRTITREPQHRGTIGKRDSANDPNTKVIEEKRVWVWQKEFRNP